MILTMTTLCFIANGATVMKMAVSVMYCANGVTVTMRNGMTTMIVKTTPAILIFSREFVFWKTHFVDSGKPYLRGAERSHSSPLGRTLCREVVLRLV